MKLMAAAVAVTAISSLSMSPANAQLLNLDFSNGADDWRIVVDGVMGGRSSGRVAHDESGYLEFTGRISLENNGGFSQMRTAVTGSSFEGADGIELRYRGDGRTYKFDVRCSNVRLMAGAFQTDFESEDGDWQTARLPFDSFTLYNFGRRVPNAPAITPTLIESIGVTLADKKEGSFELEVDWIRAYSDDSSDVASNTNQSNDLLTVARSNGLTVLADLVQAADPSEFLPAEGRLTVFAPTDDAFKAIPAEQVEALVDPANRETLRTVLAHHVSTGALSSSNVFARSTIDVLSGQRIEVDASNGFRIDESNVVGFDVPFDGGIVHVIDTVLMPELRSISEIAASSDQLSTLLKAVKAAELGDSFEQENGPWTLFAPVNDAFASLPVEEIERLLDPSNRSELVSILGLHVVPGRLYSNELLGAKSASTLFGEPVAFALSEGRLSVSESRIIKADIEASNGVVHLIETVLLPSGETQPMLSDASAEVAEIIELAVERGAPLFNIGRTDACAAIYEVATLSILALTTDRIDPRLRERLEMGAAEADEAQSASERAWAYRRAFDAVYPRLIDPGTQQSGSMARNH